MAKNLRGGTCLTLVPLTQMIGPVGGVVLEISVLQICLVRVVRVEIPVVGRRQEELKLPLARNSDVCGPGNRNVKSSANV